MNKLDKQYQQLLQDIIDYGVEKKDRTGTGTKSIFGYTIRHNMSEGFPLLTTKKMAWKTMVTELLWFLRGDTNIKFLVDNGCNIWNGDAIKNYEKHNGEISWGPFITKEEAFVESMKNEEFAKTWGELGPIYGKQWRSWNTKQFESLNDGNFGHKYNDVPIDQIQNLINDLKTNPDSRRMMVNAWNVGELDQMVLPPCHYGFQVYTRELSPLEIIEQSKKDGLWQNEIPEGMTLSELQKDFKTRAISLMWNQRSVDTFLGLPFNIASYGLLLTILAKEVNMVPDQLIGNLGDTHLYLNHIEQAKEQVGREPFELSTLVMVTNPELKFDEYVNDNFKLVNYQSHPSIKAPLSN
jgi:thymidylate synthase